MGDRLPHTKTDAQGVYWDNSPFHQAKVCMERTHITSGLLFKLRLTSSSIHFQGPIGQL